MQLLVGPSHKDDCVPNRGAAVPVRRPPGLQPILAGALGVKDALFQLVGENSPRLATIVVLDQNLGREPVAVDGDYADQGLVRMLEQLVLSAHADVFVFQADPVGPVLPPLVELIKSLGFPVFWGDPSYRFGCTSLRVRGPRFVLLGARVPVHRTEPPAIEK